MSPYRPPLPAIRLALRAAGLDEILKLPAFSHVTAGDVEAVLDGLGRFTEQVVAPSDRVGDVHGATFDPATGSVTVPAPIADAYRRWVADGWAGLSLPAEHGGGDLPALVGAAAEEMLTSANLALSLNPMLTHGSVHLLARWGSAEQRARFLPPLTSGRWSGTMNLTEPDAGSDVGAVRTRAVPRPDGTWSITGTKIFITWGEHDLAGNIVHLVLARTPGAPPGTKGISLFVVPRHLVSIDGCVGERNAVRCSGLEHKLGIHSSPTCVLDFDGAIGELVGPEHGGMAAMFTMMNAARLSVGIEGLGVSVRSFQQAIAYARSRRQGRTASTPAGESAAIVEHPDVRRMLLLMASSIEAMRALLYATAVAADFAAHHPEAEVRRKAVARADLLTPLAKAWSTDEGVRTSSLAIQVHGGMGYVEETGVAQRYRDARIAPIYEGTNGIQAIDLVSRKVRRDQGAAVFALLDELDALGSSVEIESAKGACEALHEAISTCRQATRWLLAVEEEQDWLAGATPYLELLATTVAGGLLARQMVVADEARHERADALAGQFEFYAIERLATVPALLMAATSGAGRLDEAYIG